MDEFYNLIDFYDRVAMNERVPKRYVTDMQNPIDYYSDKEFKNRFRFVNILIFLYKIHPVQYNRYIFVLIARCSSLNNHHTFVSNSNIILKPQDIILCIR